MEFCVFELVSEQNFNLNLQFWIFAPNLPKKRYSQLKTEQAVLGLQASTFCVINFNSTVVFKHFEDLRDLIILNINNFIMISKVMIKFRSKFQFQIPLQFYSSVEKVESCDGNGQKFWQVRPSFQPFQPILVTNFFFSWLWFKHTEYKGTLT